MEATAVSVGKAVLEGALGYAKSKAAEEIALQLGIDRDVAFIVDELEMMQSFLMTADEEQDKHKVFLTWVKQIRELAYNVEDTLMDFTLHSDKKPSCWCILHTLRERHDIAREVKDLRAKVEDVSNRNLRYQLIKRSGSNHSSVEEQTSVAAAAIFGIKEARHATFEQDKSKINLQQLIKSEEKDLRVIAVCGTSCNLGKTSEIRKAYDDQEVYKGFQCRAWVQLMSPFNPNKFFKDLVRQFQVYSREVNGKSEEGNAPGYDVLIELEKLESLGQSYFAKEVAVHVNTKRYLIVIDGLSSVVEWDWVKTYFPDKKNGSRIIVSTQQVEIAILCTEQPYQVTRVSDSTGPTSKSNRVTSSWNNSAISNSEIQEEEPKFMYSGIGNAFSSTGKKFERSRTIALVDDVLVGRKAEKSRIIDLICQPDHKQGCKVISVWGMGGLGKTTLVRSIYKSQQLCGWRRAWVTASRPFNREMLLRSVGLQLDKDIQENPVVANESHQEKKIMTKVEVQELIKQTLQEKKNIAMMGPQELIQKLTRFLETQKCLIVIDDLLSIEEWDSVKEIFAKANRIIVTTRGKDVAKYCSREDKNMYSLEGLKGDTALNLFKQKVFVENTEQIDLHSDHDMMEQARLILKKCDGLPLAISTIGGFLATKPKTTTEWRKMNDRINTELEINPELRTIKNVLLRSYDGLPYYLKSSFLYLSIFPEDHMIRQKRVVRRCVAEGYSKEMHGMIAEEVGNKYFDELFDRSMILQGEDVNIYGGKNYSFQLHDIMRQICISKAREENLVLTLEEGCSLCSTNGTIRHLAISSNWERDKDAFETMLDLSHLRSLTVFGNWGSFFISSKMRFLRVLDLEDTFGISDHDLDQICKLFHLKYLSLRGCENIHHLPDSIGNLRNLQTLDVSGTRISELPATITRVSKLQYLRANCVYVPREIEKLNALHTFGRVDVRHEEGIDTLKGFKHLMQLRKLAVVGLTAANSEEFWSAIASLKHLRSLSVNRDFPRIEFDCSLGGRLFPPIWIESLKLAGKLARLTEWIHHLQNLSRLQLRETELQQDAVWAIGNLPNLEILHMRFDSFLGKELLFVQASFPRLFQLVLLNMRHVTFVKFEDGTMPKLELLQADQWGEHWEGRQEFTGLRYLTKLKEIWLGSQISEEFKENVQNQLAEYPNNVSLKLMSRD
ncbi:hypothetical protein SEVIR_4G041100v4 [Setaria viridis]|uniref:NB-ARC domain-containing protein n=1 Tax=Setaria viridis TaxID=4556 RepID=A0A4V6D7W3_SETVI|nr:hypothetical protein SEVIR_4G041100v2 [Setaria viridis]